MKEKLENLKSASENVLTAVAEMMDAQKEVLNALDNVEITPQGEWLEVNEHTADKRCSNCGRVTSPTEYCHGCGSHNMGIDKKTEV